MRLTSPSFTYVDHEADALMGSLMSSICASVSGSLPGFSRLTLWRGDGWLVGAVLPAGSPTGSDDQEARR